MGDDVMDYSLVAGNDLGCLDPLVLFEFRGKSRIDVLVRGMRLDRVLLRHRQNVIRLSNLKVGYFFRKFGQIFRIALFSSLRDPIDDRVDLLLAKARDVREITVMRIGVPRRHLSGRNLFANRILPWQNIFIVEDGERRDVFGLMTSRTVFVKDGSYITIEGKRLLLAKRAATVSRQQEHAHADWDGKSESR